MQNQLSFTGQPKKKLTPMKAIRKKCLDCSGGSFTEVANCPIDKCPLYIYRFGHRPKPQD